MDTSAASRESLLPLLKNRYSPRAFSARPIEPDALQRIFEAARWSASCNNEQPWRFLAGQKGNGDSWERILSVLTENNQRWAKSATVLMIVCSASLFSTNGKPNKWHMYDAGQAAVHMTIQALHENIYVHQMGGFDPQKAIEEFSIPTDIVPISAIAMGYLGDVNALPEDLQKREHQPGIRTPLNELVFSGTWGNTSNFL